MNKYQSRFFFSIKENIDKQDSGLRGHWVKDGPCWVLLTFSFEKDRSVAVCSRQSFRAQVVKNLPAMQETPVEFLGQEDLLEKG